MKRKILNWAIDLNFNKSANMKLILSIIILLCSLLSGCIYVDDDMSRGGSNSSYYDGYRDGRNDRHDRRDRHYGHDDRRDRHDRRRDRDRSDNGGWIRDEVEK